MRSCDLIREMIAYNKGDVKRINHALKVYAFAKTIGELEGMPRAAQEVLEAAAILHDIGIHEAEKKHGSAAGIYQQMEGPAIAKEIMMRLNGDMTVVDRVCWIIGHHHTYTEIDALDFQMLVEADLLVNIEEEEIPECRVGYIIGQHFKTKTGLAFAEALYRKD